MVCINYLRLRAGSKTVMVERPTERPFVCAKGQIGIELMTVLKLPEQVLSRLAGWPSAFLVECS